MRMRMSVGVAGVVLVLASPLSAQVVSQGAPGARPAPPAAGKLDDTAGTTDANADAAAKADAQTRRIVDKQAAYRAAVDKSIADYDAKMEEYRRQVRENEARNAATRARNEARAALYKACVAGDKAACRRYDAGM